MIRTLERKPTPEDIRDAASDGEAAEQLKLEFQIPAVSKWVEHNGERLYRTLDELKDWHKKRLPFQLMHFDDPLERWAFWQKRYVTCGSTNRSRSSSLFALFQSFAHLRHEIDDMTNKYQLTACSFLDYTKLQTIQNLTQRHKMRHGLLYSTWATLGEL
jgi:hypothetical protein